MKKRLFSILLALVVLVGMLPMDAFAAIRDTSKNQARVTVENKTYADGAWTGTLVDTWVDIDSSSTAMSCVVAALDAGGYTQSGAESGYIGDINGLSAGTANGMDGWMILVNDWFINAGADAISVENGDEIKVVYSMDMGEDYGGTWANNDKTVKALSINKGELSPAFDSATHAYTLTVPAGTTGVVVKPTATNKNFQVRSSVDGTEYKRSDTIPVAEGTVITVTCGDVSWPSMNAGEWGSGAENVPAEVYTVTVAMEAANTAPELTGDAAQTAQLTVGDTFTLDLKKIFTDADGDALTYQVSVNGAEAIAAEAGYSYTAAAAGTDTLVFTANDGKAVSPAYTVTLTVTEASPGTAVTVTDNVIDITDYTVASWSRYKNIVTNITVEGGTVLSASEDGQTVYIKMDPADTEADAALTVTFGFSVGRGSITQDVKEVTLVDGEATMTVVINSSYAASIMKGSVTYTIHITGGKAPTEPPIRVMESDSKEIYENTTLELNLTDYFKAAKRYYLVEADTMTLLEGKTYSFTSTEPGIYTLTFAAENDIGRCPDDVTVTVTVKEIVGGAWIGYATSNGSVDFVTFTDANGDPIEEVQASYADKTITVLLPKTYDPAGTVTATFTRTANSSDIPFLTPNNAFNRAYSNRTDTYTNTLSGGSATRTVYLYNLSPGATSNHYETWTITYSMINELPALAEGVAATAEATVTAGEAYTLDLSVLFTDADGDALTYQVSIDGAAAVAAEASYSYTTNTAGTYTLVFTASDGKGTSTDTYTVTLTVENVKETYDMTVYVPEAVTPAFYISGGYGSDGTDILGDALTALKGETADGLTVYTVSYPINAQSLSVRAEGWGGMAFAAQQDGAVTLRQVQLQVVDYNNAPAESTNTATYGAYTAVAGEKGWLLVTGAEYTYTAVPANTTDLATAAVTQVLEAGAEVCTVELMLGINNPTTITATTGAKVQLYNIDTNKYYVAEEFDAKIIQDNGDGTTTHYFSASGDNLVYRVSMDGKITKMGYFAWKQTAVTVVYSEDDKSDTYRRNDYSGTGYANSGMTEDSVLLNINSRNHLSMTVGQSKTLKAYRAWEIIKISYQNYILTPDFTYTILSGEDVVSLTEKESPSTADGDWMTLTALKEGVAVIEVTYGAVEVTGGSYDGIYGASDPARTGIVVVQVGGSNDTSVDFGIDCFASAGTPGSSNVTYNPNSKRAWDAEFDTLYFTGSSGQLSLTPTADSAVTEVAVSHNKGASWTVLSGDSGTYTAKIVSGNNIIRVKTASGTAYQVVRGDKITVKLAEVADKSDGDGIVEAGETIRVTLVGLHAPIPKMAGNYNPGFLGNSDGYSGVHLNYTSNGQAIHGTGAQYNFITAANYLEITMPEDGSSVTLSDGYIGLGVIGLTSFTTGGDSHRNIPDSGCATRDSSTTYHTRSVLPEITVFAGDASAPNNAPVVRSDAVTEGSIYTDQNYAINPDTLFSDPDGNVLTFTVSVNGGEAVEAPVDYKFSPSGAGTYTLTFTATDGKESVQHTVTVIVTERPQEEEEKDDTFGLEESQIAGYVTVSFEDHGVRVAGETGLKYPVPLGSIIEPTKVPFIAGENMAQVTQRLLEHLDIGWSYSGSLTSGFYLGAISGFEVDGTPYGSMGEFDAGTGSGWMVTLNGWFIDAGASEFAVKNGDVIKWQYTCQLGKDIGDDSYYASVEDVIDLIDAIGKVAKNSGEKIEDAREAYDKLTPEEQKRVSNYAELTAAEEAYDKLLAAAVEDLIDSIDEDSADFEEAVKAAQGAYNDLTAGQKKLVDNYDRLTDYLKQLADAEDVEAAEAVEDLIDALGTVTADSEDAVKAARDAYEALTDEQKALVENLAVLEAAEEALAQLHAFVSAEDIYKTTGDYLENLGTPVSGSVGGEWMVIGLIRSNREIPGVDDYYESVVKYVQENINDQEQLHRAKSTENSRLILALTAIGKDVTDVGGHDLLQGLSSMEFVKKQGINGPIWALIAFDSGNYPVPEGDVTREALIRVILDAQLTDGGWALSGTASDADITAMALQALAPYYETNAEVKAAVDKALVTLSCMQAADGSFGSIDGQSCESVAQVIAALAALGIDADQDERFIRNGVSALDALCAFYVEGGGFRHIADGALDGMATEQGYYALAAYFRMLDGKNALYNMTDVIDKGGDPAEEEPTGTQPMETEPAVEEEDEKGGFPWWLLLLILVLACGAMALLIATKPKKRRR